MPKSKNQVFDCVVMAGSGRLKIVRRPKTTSGEPVHHDRFAYLPGAILAQSLYNANEE
jgi:hypothetical protein